MPEPVQDFAPMSGVVNEIFPQQNDPNEVRRVKEQFGEAFDFKQPQAKDWPK